MSQGQTQALSLSYTVEAQFVHGTNAVVTGTIPGRRAAQKVYVFKVFAAFFACFFACIFLRKTREGWTCRFRKAPRTEGGDEVQAVSTQGSRQVCLSGARNPRICSISRFGKNIPAIFPGLAPEFSSGTPERIAQTATAFSSFLIFVC